MNARIRMGRAAFGALALAALPHVALACAVCTTASNERTRKAFFDTTIFLSLLPLGLAAVCLVWLARKGRDVLRSEFEEREDAVVPAPETPRS